MRAEGLRHLRQKKTDASRTGVDENFIARPDRTGGVGQVVSGHALEHGSGRLLKTDAIGDLYQAVGGSHSQLGIGSGYTAPGNAVAGFYLCDVCPNCHNRTSSLLTKRIGQFSGISALPKVHVDEIDAGRLDADESFARPRRRSGKVAEGKDVGTTGRENLDGLHFELDADETPAILQFDGIIPESKRFEKRRYQMIAFAV